MRVSRKIASGLQRRRKVFNSIPGNEDGSGTKFVRKDKGTAAFRKPGSQNRKKGYGKPTK